MFYVIALSRWSLALVFAVAVAGKFRSRAGFAASVRDMVGVTDRAAGRLAVASIGAEALAAILLLIPATGRVGAALAGVLLLSFTLLILRLILRRETVACSCFGASTEPAGWLQVGRNTFLLALAVLSGLAWSPNGMRSGLVTVAFAAVAVATVVASLDDVVFLLSPAESRRQPLTGVGR